VSDQDHRSYAKNDEIELDLLYIVAILKKWARLIVVMSLLLALAAGVISKLMLAPVYQAKTLLMVTKATEKLQTNVGQQQNNLEEVVASAVRMPVWTMNTYQGQLKSEALMQRVSEKLHLNAKAASLAGMINTGIVKDSNLIEVTVQNTDPVLASRIANTLAAEYQKMMNEKNQDQMSRSVSFFQEQRSITDQELQAAVDNLNRFESQPRGVAVLEAEFEKVSADMVGFDSRLKSAQVEVERLYAGVASLEQELLITPRIIVTTVGSSQQAYEEVNPVYTSIAQQLAAKRAELAEKQGEAAALSAMVGNMKGQLDALQAELVSKKSEQDKLAREVERLKETAETLAKKETETQIAKSIDLGDSSVMVLSEAFIPTTPVKPNTRLNIALALVMGLMVFTLLAFVMEYLDNTLKSSEDIHNYLGLPVLGLIPEANEDTKLHNHYCGG
jgi:succinoglycan biosynthesis transport protein ExoP